MFQKIVTTVMLDGRTTSSKRGEPVEDREYDMFVERERLSRIAQGNNNVQSVEECTHALVVIYGHGTTKVYNWVAVRE
jgi:hypothetical protein